MSNQTNLSAAQPHVDGCDLRSNFPEPPSERPDKTGVLVLVEGLNDIEFLRRISRILHAHDPCIPDLNVWEQRGRLIFIPLGGGNLQHWSHRTGPLGWREFHLYDRETPPESEIREQGARLVNTRPGCHAVVTNKHSLENYLHPAAIEEAEGIQVTFSDHDAVADVVARACLSPDCIWGELSHRAQKRLRYRTKQWLNRDAVDRMTPSQLTELDPTGELIAWLKDIAQLSEAAKGTLG